ncbi:MAG: glycosyltransferase family 4 protein [Xenococcus sp. (in: cyanobacteria)]
MNTMQKVLTLVGDPNHINTWSNTAYFFLKASQKEHFLDRGLPLQPEKISWLRILWNLSMWLRTGEKGGFQYSLVFLKRLFAQVKICTEPVEFISHFPLLPPHPWSNEWQVNYYIDATLKQNFDDYGLSAIIATKIRKIALETERKNYLQAKRIICMSRAAAKSIMEDYKISATKVYVIPGGANLDEDYLSQMTNYIQSESGLFNPLRLGFIGKDWQRKGLVFLLEIAEVLASRNIPVKVIVIGPQPHQLPKHRLLKSMGFIDKFQDMQKFMQIVRSCHFGCLFSSAEAFGISNLEFLRLGVPVIANRIGGIPDTLPEGLGFLFEPNSPPELVADLLESFVNNPSSYQELRHRVIARSEEFSWQNTVRKFIEVWQGSEEFLYDSASAK